MNRSHLTRAGPSIWPITGGPRATDTRELENIMFFWKLIIGAVLGAVLVNEWEKAGRLYDSAHTKIADRLRTWQSEAKGTGNENVPSHERSASSQPNNP